MIPSKACFVPVMLETPETRLRTACFAADGARRGVCVLLNGQTEFIEKYFEVIDELRIRGFAVAALDWRGQGGSQRLLPGLKAHIEDFSQYDRDLDSLLEQVVGPMLEPNENPVGLAHSMGGHILLRHLAAHPDRFAAAAFSAPMVRFSTGIMPGWFLRGVTTAMMARGRGRDFVWGVAGRDPLKRQFSRQVVTSDPVRFQRTQDILRRHPDLRLGGPTWGWVAAALRAQDRMAEPAFAATLTTPVLICGAGKDRVVDSGAACRLAEAMPDGRYVEIAGAEHEILMERDGIRAAFWKAFDAFMAKA